MNSSGSMSGSTCAQSKVPAHASSLGLQPLLGCFDCWCLVCVCVSNCIVRIDPEVLLWLDQWNTEDTSVWLLCRVSVGGEVTAGSICIALQQRDPLARLVAAEGLCHSPGGQERCSSREPPPPRPGLLVVPCTMQLHAAMQRLSELTLVAGWGYSM
jgi:hypothetical protein